MDKYYKISKSSKLGIDIMEVIKRAIECKKKASSLIDKFKIKTTSYFESPSCFSGGICEFAFKDRNDIPENFTKPYRINGVFLTRPKKNKKNAQILEAIKALPYVKDKDFKNLLNLDLFKGYNLGWSNLEFIRLSVCESVKVPEACEEITVSEFNRLN